MQQLAYPKKSHRKQITIPSESRELAELMGAIFGDGGIGHGWQLVVSFNSRKDLDYSTFLTQLINELFGIKASLRKRPNENTLLLRCSSTNMIDFLITKGAVRGNKILQKIDIPAWIAMNPDYQRAFVRGLVDTDGCLYIHKHTVAGKKYENIGFCFTSHSSSLTISIAKILAKNGIEPHIADNNHRIYLYRSDAVLKYLNIFGSSNPRIYQKYQEWRGGRAA